MEINVNLNHVQIKDELWSYYMKLVKEKVIPYQYEILNDRIEGAVPSGAINNFKIAAGLVQGEYEGRVFQDSDVAKWLEAVAYCLSWSPDKVLENLADGIIDLLESAQCADGYLNTYFAVKNPGNRWSNLLECHEMYCFGHLAEAAVAYYEATGKRKFLGIMIKYADLICDKFGDEAGKLRGYDGHQESELALMKLYRVTGDEKYLKLARFFLEERGAEPYYFDMEWEKRGRNYYYPHPSDVPPGASRKFNQSHLRPAEQSDAVGHAVRFAYMCTGMSDVAYETGDRELMDACRRLWDSAVDRNMYITGAIGSSRHGEAFTFDYDLPNDRVYGETCASLGMVFFACSMLKNEKDSKYADIMELELYNILLSGIALDGCSFFYVNPLEVNPKSCMYDPEMVKVKPLRQKWFATACCPPNIARTLGSIGKYVYSQTDKVIYVHLYISSETDFTVQGRHMKITNKSRYPRDGKIGFRFDLSDSVETTIAFRVPGWTKKYSIKLNGTELDNYQVNKGYAEVKRLFNSGDTIELDFEMSPRFYRSNDAVRYNAGKVALKVGPIVYCLEEIDNGNNLHNLSVDPTSIPVVGNCLNLPVEYNEIIVDGYKDINQNEKGLYSLCEKQERIRRKLKFIPYFLWCNRNDGEAKEMAVWIRESFVSDENL